MSESGPTQANEQPDNSNDAVVVHKTLLEMLGMNSEVDSGER